MSQNVAVRLQPLVTKFEHARLGVVEQETDQLQIFCSVDGQPEAMIGFVGTSPDSGIHLITSLPSTLESQIVQAVRDQHPSASASQVFTAPTPQQIAEALQGNPDDEVEDEELPDTEVEES